MTNVLIRGVDTEDLEQIRAAATTQGLSLQSYLRDAVHAQASYLRRQEALRNLAERLHGAPEVADDERAAVLAAIDSAHLQRADELSDRPVQ